ncbi:hypothetical protein ACDH67_18150 (plasmid) [Acinetobacter baumannii]|uniref:hypothetical protein n=1 Tax=Acinetobacter baumannii TaxID=470 RepID=UPI00397CF3DF
MSYEPPRDGYTNGYIVDVMYDNRPSKYPAVFRTYVRIPDYVERIPEAKRSISPKASPVDPEAPY